MSSVTTKDRSTNRDDLKNREPDMACATSGSCFCSCRSSTHGGAGHPAPGGRRQSTATDVKVEMCGWAILRLDTSCGSLRASRMFTITTIHEDHFVHRRLHGLVAYVGLRANDASCS